MSTEPRPQGVTDDERTLNAMGYSQELSRRMSGFSNFAISLSIICILAGGITSFPQGLSSVGGASIGIGWPLVCLFSLVVALTMGQVASAFPTAGGLYHWASILGGRGWGWLTAWFNLFGLVLVIAAVNVGAYQFVMGAIVPKLGFDPGSLSESSRAWLQIAGVSLITFSHAIFNHKGIRVTTALTDFSGYLILAVAAALTIALLVCASSLEFNRLVTFTNYSGARGGGVWPETASIVWLFALGFLLPAYTITGFDASAHTSEETIGAARNVPRGIVRSVVVSGVFGWIMLCAVIVAAPNLTQAAAKGADSFYWIIDSVLPPSLALALYIGIAIAQYLCGLAGLTSTSRMAFAFARDGGLPFSQKLRRISPKSKSPSAAIWASATVAVLFTVYTPVYVTLTAACAIFLYLSYVLPTALGFFAYGRTWTRMGPWQLGAWYKPLAVLCVAGCAGLLVIGTAPPNEKIIFILGGAFAFLAVFWFAIERKRFKGPPHIATREEARATVEEVQAQSTRA